MKKELKDNDALLRTHGIKKERAEKSTEAPIGNRIDLTPAATCGLTLASESFGTLLNGVDEPARLAGGGCRLLPLEVRPRFAPRGVRPRPRTARWAQPRHAPAAVWRRHPGDAHRLRRLPPRIPPLEGHGDCAIDPIALEASLEVAQRDHLPPQHRERRRPAVARV